MAGDSRTLLKSVALSLAVGVGLAGCSHASDSGALTAKPAIVTAVPRAETAAVPENGKQAAKAGFRLESTLSEGTGSAAKTIGYHCDPTLPNPSASVVPVASDHTRYMNVNVATLWRSPQSPRTLDEPSLRAPADIPAWLHPLSIRDKLALVGKMETEALYGEPVELLEERGDWVRVAVPAQRTPLNDKGYPGWLPKKQLTDRSAEISYAGCRQAVVSKPTAGLFEDGAMQKQVLQVSFGTRLAVLDVSGDAIRVMTPADGPRWLAANDAVVRESAMTDDPVTGEQLITLGKQFLGLPYLWAGASGFGFDCSGFTYSLYRYYGIELPRDAKDQAKAGRAADRRHLQPGDLLFFAYDKGKGMIHHVALYAGDGMILHSPKTERTVELLPLATPEYASEIAAARRILPD